MATSKYFKRTFAYRHRPVVHRDVKDEVKDDGQEKDDTNGEEGARSLFRVETGRNISERDSEHHDDGRKMLRNI